MSGLRMIVLRFAAKFRRPVVAVSAPGALLAMGSFLAMGIGPARADECFDLSYQRNAIYKDAGYCFKTAQQIENFGNAGCTYDNQADVPLSARQRARIAEIVREERAIGCR